MDHTRAVGVGRQRDLLGAIGMDSVEALAAAFGQDADEVDQHVGVARRGIDRRRMAQVRLNGVDLAYPAKRLQETGEFGPAHRHPNAIMALGQRPDDMAAKEAGAAVDGDEGVGIASGGHFARFAPG